MSLCRAKGCSAERMEDSDFCGYHDELHEDGEAFDLKAVRKRHKSLTTEEKAQKWHERRERERQHKRKGHPEWREITRRDGARTVEEMAAMYDAHRERERIRRERDLGRASKATRREAVRNAALEVLAEIKRKRIERGSKLGRTA